MINKSFIVILAIMMSLSIVSCRKAVRVGKDECPTTDSIKKPQPRKPIFAEYKYDGRTCEVPPERLSTFNDEIFRETKDLNDRFLSKYGSSSDTTNTEMYESMLSAQTESITQKYCVLTDKYVRGDRNIAYSTAIPEEQRIFDEMKKDYLGLNDTANTAQ